MRFFRLLQPTGILPAALLCTLLLGCSAKIRPSAYQAGLNAYYGALISSTGNQEDRLLEAIELLDASLAEAPADPGLLALRADARLDLLRLGVEGEARRLDDGRRSAFLTDLKLLEGRLDQPGPETRRLTAHVANLTGDLAVLGAISLQTGENGCGDNPCQVRRMQIYRIAADFYLYAATTSGGDQPPLPLSADDPAALDRAVGLQREVDHARAGYAQALGGVAQGEMALGMDDKAAETLASASEAMTSSQSFLPTFPKGYTPTPRSLSAALHETLAIMNQALGALKEPESLESATKQQWEVPLALYEVAAREELASALLAVSPKSLNDSRMVNDDQVATIIELWLEAPAE